MQLIRLVLVALVVAGCHARPETVRVRQHPSLRGGPIALERVAVMPFRPIRNVSGQGSVPEEAAPLIGAYVTEQLMARGLEVIPPSDVRIALGPPPAPGARIDPRSAAETVYRKFGADALLTGTVVRYRERVGGVGGAETSASVAFDLDIFSAPDGLRLWSGNFDETQRPLSSNVFDASRLPGGGTRWLTADELARWGAQQVTASIPIAEEAPE